MNRKQAPEIATVNHVSFVEPIHHQLGGDVKLHWIRDVKDNAFKVDLIFDAGTIKADRLVAKFCADLLLSGTNKFSSDEINERIDSLGGFVNLDVTADDATISIYGLTEHFDTLILEVLTAISEVNFPDREFEQLLQSKKQGYQVAQQKVAVRARRLFMTHLFEGTPYARQTELADFDILQKKDIIEFHQLSYLKGLQKVCVIGNLSKVSLDSLVERIKPFCSLSRDHVSHLFNYSPQRLHEDKADAVQTALRIGRQLFNRTHPDYNGFTVLNTILGGYFGSRLMSSIREEKGFTYGIGSGVAQSKKMGYFFISTEVGKSVAEEAITEIRAQIERLQTELVSAEELDLVRNYSIGQVLKNSDGPFAMMDRYLAVEEHGMDFSYYDSLLHTYNTITAADIRSLAQKYLKWEDLLVISAG